MLKQNKNNIKIRLVEKKDSKRVWEIRNDPINRKFFHSQDKINFKDHSPWFENKYFSDRKNCCFVAEANKKVIGYCRLDYDPNKEAYLVSIAIDSKNHGQGLGYHLLDEAVKQMDNQKDILAEVKKNNPASVNLFKKVDFKIDKEDKDNYYFKYAKK